MHRIVHLDLKGSPWKVEYFEKLFPILKSWGVTGLLIEWEDTFPYNGDLSMIGSYGNCGGDAMYTIEEAKKILILAKHHELEVIQLVQTIGHLEFVLKHPIFKTLREEPSSPAVLCPSKPDGQALVRAMVAQALDLQPDAKYFHIGADEVWHMAVCSQCKLRAESSEHKTSSLFLQHIQDLVLFIKQKRPNLTVLMWDDMLRKISFETLKSFQLGDLVEPVLWDYNKMEYFNLNPNLWLKYKESFPRVWAASAYKGANGSCKMWCDVKRYVSNHEAWRREIEKYSNEINFSGIILTGWSRYDHYATLCELLPVALPSLMSCLAALTSSTDKREYEALPKDQWPGGELSFALQCFMMLRDRCIAFLDGEQVTTFLNPWQIEKGYTNPSAVDSLAKMADRFLMELSYIQNEISTHLHALTGKRSASEWIETNILPTAKRLTDLRDVGALRSKCEAGVTPST